MLIFVFILALNCVLGSWSTKDVDSKGFSIPLIKYRGSSFAVSLNDERNLTVQTGHHLNNGYNMIYSAVIGLGSPQQNFHVILDTGSSDLWVVSRRCDWLSIWCYFYNRYDRRESSTYIGNDTMFSIQYIEAFSSGYISQDTLTFGNISIKNQTFGEATSISYKMFALPRLDGVFGLGFPHLSKLGALPPFFNAVSRGLFAPIFSFYLDRDSTSTYGGELYLGGVNPDHYQGKFMHASLVSDSRWQIQARSLKIGGTPVCNSYCTLIVDSGSSTIFVSWHTYFKLHEAMNITANPRGMTLLRCSDTKRLPTFTLRFDNFTIQLRSSDYVVPYFPRLYKRVFGTEYCLTGFCASNGVTVDNIWILGTNFLGAFYTKFDAGNKVIGFAKLSRKNRPK